MTKHIHAELMALYAQDAMETDKPWERWEYCYHKDEDWMGCDRFSIGFYADTKYRRKPKTSRERFEESLSGRCLLIKDLSEKSLEMVREEHWRTWQEAERQFKESGDE